MRDNPFAASDAEWGSVRVPVITLEEAISKWGEPSFIKIDVEGYEPEVLSTLHYAVGTLSFEFWAERSERAIEIMHRLSSIGYDRFNLSFGEEEKWQLAEWSDVDSVVRLLADLPNRTSGDIHAIACG